MPAAVQMKHETLLEQHGLLQHELMHARTLAQAAGEGARHYRAQLDESTFRQQAAEGHVVRLQQAVASLQRDAVAESALLQSLQEVRCAPGTTTPAFPPCVYCIAVAYVACTSVATASTLR